MESRLFQYSIPHFSFDNAKFHSMGNEDHSMGNEDHSMGNEDHSMGNEVVRVHGVTRISVPKFGVPVFFVSQEWVLFILEYPWGLDGEAIFSSRTSQNVHERGYSY